MATHVSSSRPPSISKTVIAFLLIAAASFTAGRFSASAESGNGEHQNKPAPRISRAEPGADFIVTAHREAPDADLALTSADESSRTFSSLAARRASPSRNAAMAAALKRLAATDPTRALTLAQSERNLLLRETLIHAALSGWAEASPEAASRWALALTDLNRRSEAISIVFQGAAARQPDEAVRIGRALFKTDPDAATNYGCSLVDALCASGHFETAAGLIADSDALNPVGRSILLAKTYTAWATLQPELAGRAAAALRDPSERSEALNAALGGWSQADPAGATQYAATLTTEPSRIQLVGQMLRQWAAVDADAASRWVTENELGTGADDGIAAVASAGFLPPETAAAWTEDIASPTLRSQTLLALLRSWANTDPAAARKYFEKTASLAPVDHAAAAALFMPPGGP